MSAAHDLYLCPHCGRALRIARARQHAESYYDPASARWTVLHADAIPTDPRVTLGLSPSLLSSHYLFDPLYSFVCVSALGLMTEHALAGWSALLRKWGAAPSDSAARVAPSGTSTRGVKRHRVDAVRQSLRAPVVSPAAALWHASAAVTRVHAAAASEPADSDDGHLCPPPPPSTLPSPFCFSFALFVGYATHAFD